MTAILTYPRLWLGTPNSRDTLHVLVVDDDAEGGEAKADGLRRAGFRVHTALTAEQPSTAAGGSISMR